MYKFDKLDIRTLHVEKNVHIEEPCNIRITNIEENSSIGRFCDIRDYTNIGKNCTIGISCIIEKNTTIKNDVIFGHHVVVGSPGLKIGNNCYIGHGTVIEADVCDDVILFPNSVVLCDIEKPGTYKGIINQTDEKE
jgi:UDP-3-O-[3-hydroxymyristoyl] glucosamine N-acyltransferase